MTHEEWETEKELLARKQEEEDAARLLEENERAMFVDIPSDATGTSSPSRFAENDSEQPTHLPHFPLLKPAKRNGSSLASSISPALIAIEEVSAELADMESVKELSLGHGVGEKDNTLNTQVEAPPSFKAPDWNVRNHSRPNTRLSNDSSENMATETRLEAEEDLAVIESIDDITAAWDRALLGPK